MTGAPDRYFLKLDGYAWEEATKESYVQAERRAGFRNTLGQPEEPATTSFSGGSVNGRLCYGGRNLPEQFLPLIVTQPQEASMARPMTPQAFHLSLVKKFEAHQEAVRKGEEKAYSFLEDEGMEYNGWIEHRHRWPLTDDLLCVVSLTSLDDLEDPNSGLEVPFEECGTCSTLVQMYRDYCERARRS